MSNAVYVENNSSNEHSLRYIHVITKNIVGILNRIASLMRRKRYNMEEISLSFDNEGRAHFVIAIDGALLDVQQVVCQIDKLYDVYSVYDATHLKDNFFNTYYVTVVSEKDFDNFPLKPISIVSQGAKTKGVFLAKLSDSSEFLNFITKKKYPYVKRLVSLI